MKTSLCLLCWFWALSARAQPFDLGWFTLDSGGPTAAGGSYTLMGTSGQPDAGFASGGQFTLAGGFWSLPESGGNAAPELRVSAVGLGHQVQFSWSDKAAGFRLQHCPALQDPAGWQDIVATPTPSGGEYKVVLPADAVTRFFRLYKP